jgi:guanosine-3',5'-bis(diphosphate) 3'-pyrophosphohydrolase
MWQLGENTGILLKALNFAAIQHRHQRRKDAHALPYINHPIQVAEMLWTVGAVRDCHLIAAALLHDTLEDTEATETEIKQLFGEEILAIVCEVTDDKSLPKAERKRLQVEHAPTLSPAAKQLKLADKICNIADIIEAPPEHWSWQRRWEYLMWSEQVISGLRGVNQNLEQRFDQLVAEARQTLNTQI